jgi:hypothetical protein
MAAAYAQQVHAAAVAAAALDPVDFYAVAYSQTPFRSHEFDIVQTN